MLSTPTAAAPLDCPECNGYGHYTGRITCRSCHGRGTVRCETANCLEPATRTAIGDTGIKLCAACGMVSDADFDTWASTRTVAIACDGDVETCTLAEFLAANAETLSPEDVEQLVIRERLMLGGGAQPVLVVTLGAAAYEGRVVEIQDGAGNVTYRAPIAEGVVR